MKPSWRGHGEVMSEEERRAKYPYRLMLTTPAGHPAPSSSAPTPLDSPLYTDFVANRNEAAKQLSEHLRNGDDLEYTALFRQVCFLYPKPLSLPDHTLPGPASGEAGPSAAPPPAFFVEHCSYLDPASPLFISNDGPLTLRSFVGTDRDEVGFRRRELLSHFFTNDGRNEIEDLPAPVSGFPAFRHYRGAKRGRDAEVALGSYVEQVQEISDSGADSDAHPSRNVLRVDEIFEDCKFDVAGAGQLLLGNRWAGRIRDSKLRAPLRASKNGRDALVRELADQAARAGAIELARQRAQECALRDAPAVYAALCLPAERRPAGLSASGARAAAAPRPFCPLVELSSDDEDEDEDEDNEEDDRDLAEVRGAAGCSAAEDSHSEDDEMDVVHHTPDWVPARLELCQEIFLYTAAANVSSSWYVTHGFVHIAEGAPVAVKELRADEPRPVDGTYKYCVRHVYDGNFAFTHLDTAASCRSRKECASSEVGPGLDGAPLDAESPQTPRPVERGSLVDVFCGGGFLSSGLMDSPLADHVTQRHMIDRNISPCMTALVNNPDALVHHQGVQEFIMSIQLMLGLEDWLEAVAEPEAGGGFDPARRFVADHLRFAAEEAAAAVAACPSADARCDGAPQPCVACQLRRAADAMTVRAQRAPPPLQPRSPGGSAAREDPVAAAVKGSERRFLHRVIVGLMEVFSERYIEDYLSCLSTHLRTLRSHDGDAGSLPPAAPHHIKAEPGEGRERPPITQAPIDEVSKPGGAFDKVCAGVTAVVVEEAANMRSNFDAVRSPDWPPAQAPPHGRIVAMRLDDDAAPRFVKRKPPPAAAAAAAEDDDDGSDDEGDDGAFAAEPEGGATCEGQLCRDLLGSDCRLVFVTDKGEVLHDPSRPPRADGAAGPVRFVRPDAARLYLQHVRRAQLLPLPGAVLVFDGGPPCQGTSGLNKERRVVDTLRDPRNRLCFDFVRLCGLLRPTYVLMEQVKDALLLEGGRYIKTVMVRLVRLGYQVSLEVESALDHGVPQDRQRLILTAAAPGALLPASALRRAVSGPGRPDGAPPPVIRDVYTDLPPVPNEGLGLSAAAYTTAQPSPGLQEELRRPRNPATHALTLQLHRLFALTPRVLAARALLRHDALGVPGRGDREFTALCAKLLAAAREFPVPPRGLPDVVLRLKRHRDRFGFGDGDERALRLVQEVIVPALAAATGRNDANAKRITSLLRPQGGPPHPPARPRGGAGSEVIDLCDDDDDEMEFGRGAPRSTRCQNPVHDEPDGDGERGSKKRQTARRGFRGRQPGGGAPRSPPATGQGAGRAAGHGGCRGGGRRTPAKRAHGADAAAARVAQEARGRGVSHGEVSGALLELLQACRVDGADDSDGADADDGGRSQEWLACVLLDREQACARQRSAERLFLELLSVADAHVDVCAQIRAALVSLVEVQAQTAARLGVPPRVDDPFAAPPENALQSLLQLRACERRAAGAAARAGPRDLGRPEGFRPGRGEQLLDLRALLQLLLALFSRMEHAGEGPPPPPPPAAASAVTDHWPEQQALGELARIERVPPSCSVTYEARPEYGGYQAPGVVGGTKQWCTGLRHGRPSCPGHGSRGVVPGCESAVHVTAAGQALVPHGSANRVGRRVLARPCIDGHVATLTTALRPQIVPSSIHPMQSRVVTVRESARMQGIADATVFVPIPDEGTAGLCVRPGGSGKEDPLAAVLARALQPSTPPTVQAALRALQRTSKAAAHKCQQIIGNGVPPPLARAHGAAIAACLVATPRGRAADIGAFVALAAAAASPDASPPALAAAVQPLVSPGAARAYPQARLRVAGSPSTGSGTSGEQGCGGAACLHRDDAPSVGMDWTPGRQAAATLEGGRRDACGGEGGL